MKDVVDIDTRCLKKSIVANRSNNAKLLYRFELFEWRRQRVIVGVAFAQWTPFGFLTFFRHTFESIGKPIEEYRQILMRHDSTVFLSFDVTRCCQPEGFDRPRLSSSRMASCTTRSDVHWAHARHVSVRVRQPSPAR
jgi:hypothetical protein